jgi:hypothetical protein
MAQIQTSDERMLKNSGGTIRMDRSTADNDRTNKDGTALTAQERRNALRQDWVQELLPTPPVIPGFHTCWLSTTNSMDPIYKRIQHGYQPVSVAEVPGFSGSSELMRDGEFKGCISCNEMLLFKVEDQLYQDLMTIYHYDMPNEQAQGIYEKASSGQHQDSSGKPLEMMEGDFGSLGRNSASLSRFN